MAGRLSVLPGTVALIDGACELGQGIASYSFVSQKSADGLTT